jgi:hypothetical protein
MKTPMQELIDKLNNVKPTEFCSIETIKRWAESLLEKEKEQMIDWYATGQADTVNMYEQHLKKPSNTKEK